MHRAQPRPTGGSLRRLRILAARNRGKLVDCHASSKAETLAEFVRVDVREP